MASISESGHAKNVANFKKLIEFVIGYGSNYNPSKKSLELAQLSAMRTDSDSAISFVTSQNTAFNKAANLRLIEFSDVRPLATRLVSALESTDASEETIADAKGFKKKLDGKSAAGTKSADTDAPAPKSISTSQLSYDYQIQHFEGLRAVLASEESYMPNEADLTLSATEAKQASMTAKNNAVATAYVAVSNARIARDRNLYAEDTGLVDTAAEVKKYVKSVFGATSREYAQIKGLVFRKVKSGD